MKYLTRDWYGRCCPKVGFEVIKSEKWIFKVEVHIPPEKTSFAQPHGYKEGLWEQDVAEWFIVSSRTKRYLEWNLSSNGAWWLMVFSGARQRDMNLLPELTEITTRSSRQQNSWQAELEVPEAFLVDILGDEAWTHNVCFILGKRPIQYISLNKLTSDDPDFHRPEEIMIEIKP